MPHAKPYPTFAEILEKKHLRRFWRNVAIRRKDECWPWTGTLDGKGYGIFSMDGRLLIASRAAYAIANDSVPRELCVRQQREAEPGRRRLRPISAQRVWHVVGSARLDVRAVAIVNVQGVAWRKLPQRSQNEAGT